MKFIRSSVSRSVASAILVLGITMSQAVAQSAVTPASVALEALSKPEQRKLTFLSERLFKDLVTIANMEVAGNRDAIGSNLEGIRRTAQRYLSASVKAGLSKSQAADLIWSRFMSSYSGPVPSVILSAEGIPNIEGFLDGTLQTAEVGEGNGASYVDQLTAAEVVGGVLD